MNLNASVLTGRARPAVQICCCGTRAPGTYRGTHIHMFFPVKISITQYYIYQYSHLIQIYPMETNRALCLYKGLYTGMFLLLLLISESASCPNLKWITLLVPSHLYVYCIHIIYTHMYVDKCNCEVMFSRVAFLFFPFSVWAVNPKRGLSRGGGFCLDQSQIELR